MVWDVEATDVTGLSKHYQCTLYYRTIYGVDSVAFAVVLGNTFYKERHSCSSEHWQRVLIVMNPIICFTVKRIEPL